MLFPAGRGLQPDHYMYSAHARRKVFEARKTAPEGDAVLAIITDSYKVEHEAKAAGILELDRNTFVEAVTRRVMQALGDE